MVYVRMSLPSNRVALQQCRILVLHGFIKKTPPDDLALDRKKPCVPEMKEADMAGKKTVTRKRKAVRSTAKLTTLDDVLGEEGKRDEFEAIAVKEVLAWQIERAMKEKNISRNNRA